MRRRRRHWPGRSSSRGVRDVDSQRGQHRAQLPHRFGQLGGRVGVGDDAAASKQGRTRATQERGPNTDYKLALTVAVEPANRSAVPAAVELFPLADEPQGASAGYTPDRGTGMKVLQGIEDGSTARQLTTDRREQMVQIGQSANSRLGVGDDSTRNFAQAVAQRTNHELVLGAFLWIAQQSLFEHAVFTDIAPTAD